VDANVTIPLDGRPKLPMNERSKNIPVLFGEKDIPKDNSTGFPNKPTETAIVDFYAGGQPTRTLILLDEATVYNASHFAGISDL